MKRSHEVNRAEALGGHLRWYYLSFADESGFLGAAVVQAFGPGTAAVMAHATGCNPGGQIVMHPLEEGFEPEERHRYRLMSKSEMESEIGPTEPFFGRGPVS